MLFRRYLHQAQNELLRKGRRVNPVTVVDHALTLDGAREALAAEADAFSLSFARREASKLLKEFDQPNDDPEMAQLFDDSAYRPPRCIAFRDEQGEVWRKAIEFATYAECIGYTRMLDENITAAQRARREWLRWFRAHDRAIAQAGTVGDALRGEGQLAA